MTEKKGFLDNENFKKLPFKKKVTAFCYAIKYYAQGDPWEFALDYAVSMQSGWKNN